MSKGFIEDTTLTSIGDAIREKNGTTTQYKPNEMASAITAIESGGGDINEYKNITLTGNLSNLDYMGQWDEVLKKYNIITQDITNLNYGFTNSQLEKISFTLNCKLNTEVSLSSCFSGATRLKELPDILNITVNNLNSCLQNLYYIQFLPDSWLAFNFDKLHQYRFGSVSGMFDNCQSLREIPSQFLSQLYTPRNVASTQIFYRGFVNCYTLDELVGLPVPEETITGNMFNSSFNYDFRLQNLIFTVNDNGTPKIVTWSNQTINLTSLGYNQLSDSFITDINSGITIDKKVVDDTTYQALKNDPDWFTSLIEYSRYNHDSAVRTINSLPDCSAGSKNTIQFRGAMGSATDGGAISNLTEEEIAVATDKGWTVTLV